MKGGARSGAGRPAGRAKTNHYCRLDVRQLARAGHLQAGHGGTWAWSNGLWASYSVGFDSVTLSYRFEFSDGGRDIEAPIRLDRTPCNLGGSRAWFCCPGCSRRVAIIYLYGWPRCRTCARLAYPSQSEDMLDRSWRRTFKIERRLACGAGEWNYRRPSGMRRATYDRLKESYWQEDMFRERMLEQFLQARGMYL